MTAGIVSVLLSGVAASLAAVMLTSHLSRARMVDRRLGDLERKVDVLRVLVRARGGGRRGV